MRRFALVVGIVVALGLGAVPSAVAANPGVIHFTMTDSFTDPNFCETRHAVDTAISIKQTTFLAPNQPVDVRSVGVVDFVYTNPQNNATVFRHQAGQFSETIISGDPQGVHTVERTVTGLSGHLHTTDGVVLLGAGNLVLHEVFNGDEFVSREIVVNRGPHPNIESDLVLFCEVATAALGLN
ncbi:hypothetical protein EV644_103345 [Kribbella orskensis]|uniref:Allene oxide cyclase barrel-like domain-containing protein n=1 Tax=Kribbella orskensis TaxID=2512216 RepID=A0ABY2BQ82_9ACTN|nr:MULTISPECIES: hypothetical protein [Kribbella]TCN39573.1 hypothetical protein EV642_10676 [Kribbella sp. VKM Ac-2500]TCO27645.1 hypothetical protein EV644_103345 [Kribbella orskensis]